MASARPTQQDCCQVPIIKAVVVVLLYPHHLHPNPHLTSPHLTPVHSTGSEVTGYLKEKENGLNIRSKMFYVGKQGLPFFGISLPILGLYLWCVTVTSCDTLFTFPHYRSCSVSLLWRLQIHCLKFSAVESLQEIRSFTWDRNPILGRIGGIERRPAYWRDRWRCGRWAR